MPRLKGKTIMNATILHHPAQPARHADAAVVARTLQPEEGVFLFSADELTSRARQFLDSFPGTVSYAVKCNPSKEVLSTLAAAGISSWDVASVQEMEDVAAVSKNAHFHYHNPVKSRREIADAYNIYGCRRFVVDCREELEKIIAVIGKDDTVEIAVRLVCPATVALLHMISRPSLAHLSTSVLNCCRRWSPQVSSRC